MKNRLLLALPVALATTLTATADVADNFDSYVAGSQLHGQGGWKGWDNSAGAGALVSSAFAYSSPNSVNITGGSDLVRTFSGVTSGLWTFSIMQYIPSTSTGNSYFILLNQYNDGGPYDWSVQIQNNMGTSLITSDIGGGATLPMVKDAWAEYRFDISITGNTVSEYYNNQFLSTHAWHDGTGQNALGAIDLYANNAGPVYYDNLQVSLVPEPSAISFMALVGLALLIRSRKQS